ncbi:recombinase family protein [Pedococcus bigeumensis]|uniref:recombinase family protein n=1 Tax=Pedococcus bigeumensis TaxID=433644 RepID=UPI002FECCA15
MTTAAIYTRISADREGRELGVDRQEKDCRALAAREGLTVVATYGDNDISASTISRKRRPSWEQMLEDAEAGRFQVILAYSSSRLTRRPVEREDLLDLHDECGTQLWFANGGRLDLTTTSERTAFRMLGTLDTAEPERTSELVRRKHLELAQAGRHNGPRPFGWDVIGKSADARLVINPAEAAVIRECVARVLAGEGIWKITRDLNDRGITTSTGRPWATQVLRRMLLRDTNYGYRRHQPRKGGRAVGKDELYKGQWEPIIDREAHERLVAVLTDPARRSNNRGTEAKYLLTGVAECGACGRPVVGTNEFTYLLKNGRTRTYPHAYKCPHAGCMKVQRRMADVDALVNSVVVGVLERDGVRLLGGDAVAAEQARERIAALQAKLALAADQFAEDAITGDQLQRITGRLRPQLEAEQSKLRRSQPTAGLSEFTGPSAAAAWAKADVESRKGIIRVMGMRIVIEPVGAGNGRGFDPESVTIMWR